MSALIAFARLQAEPAGNRQLKCPYHGWIYNAEGLPYAIPRKPLIAEITPETLCDYRLSRWHVRTRRAARFHQKGATGRAARRETISSSSSATTRRRSPSSRRPAARLVENTDYVVKANWKLVVENTLEGYHVDCVHPNTIKKLGMAGLSQAHGERRRCGAPIRPAEQRQPLHF